MAGLTDLGTGLELRVEWQQADGVTAPELAATWCRLEIAIDGHPVTAVEDRRTGAIRRGIYVSAYPLAEWIAEHWWLLRRHVRPSAVPRAHWAWRHVRLQPWLRQHNLRAAGGGMPWPDVTLVPEGPVSRIVWSAGQGPADSPVAFLTSGDTYLRSDEVADALSRFVEQVLERLAEVDVRGTVLQDEWSLLIRSDEKENAFASAMARLGQDPFYVPDALADDVIASAELLEPEVLAEFLDSVRPDGVRVAMRWLQKARGLAAEMPPAPLLERLSMTAQVADATGVGRPWLQGYATARSVRAELGLRPNDVLAVGDLVSTQSLVGSASGLQGLVSAQERKVGLVLPAELGLGPASERFAQARALGLGLLTDRNLLLLDPAHTDLTKASRAFAAELLAPADGIGEFVSALPEITSAAFEALAGHYGTSPLLVQHQYDNQIAGALDGYTGPA